MIRATRGLRLRAVRGSRGTWKTYDAPAGPVRDMRGADSALKAFLDGGGCNLDAHHDTTAGDGSDPEATATRRTTRRARTTRRGGRR